MRLSHFRRLMDDEFGPGYAASVAHDQVLTELAGRTAEEAIADGVDPADVWSAICRAMDVREERRLGSDPRLPPAGSSRSPTRGAPTP